MYNNYNPYSSLNYSSNNFGGGLPSNTFANQIVSQTPIQELIRVTGIDGAKAYQMPPNSVVPLFDANNDIMYIKTTDGAGFPSIRAFSFTPIEDAQEQPTEYVSRSEFDALVAEVKELMNGKQPVPESDAK